MARLLFQAKIKRKPLKRAAIRDTFVGRHGRYSIWIVQRRGKPSLVYRPSSATG
jgi:hypothetical protein